MLETPDLRFFSTLARSPTLAAAARALDVTPSAVSQRLTQIESRLGLRLVERGRGRLTLTAEGETLARRAGAILHDLDNLNEDMASRRGEVSGPLQIIAPFGFGRIHVAPMIAELACTFPGIAPDLILSDDPYSAAGTENWDLIIHIGKLADSTLVQRKLASNQRFLCASPEYLARHGRPLQIADLRDHACGVIREDQADVSLLGFTGPDGVQSSVRIHPAFASNDGEVVKSWAVQGLGIVFRSEWSVASELKDGILERVLLDFALPDADITALVSPRTLRTARVECALEKLVSYLSVPPWK
jgi:DNA-binding transcriptional LysR family regulator